jgi:hypothetical protein
MWYDYTEENSERTSDGFKTVLLLLRFSRDFNKHVPLRENGNKMPKYAETLMLHSNADLVVS